MSSLLAFVWRRRQSSTTSDEYHMEGNMRGSHHRLHNNHHAPLGLLECSSEDTTQQADINEDYTYSSMISIPRQCVVVTPDGLKQRRSLVDVQNALFGTSNDHIRGTKILESYASHGKKPVYGNNTSPSQAKQDKKAEILPRKDCQAIIPVNPRIIDEESNMTIVQYDSEHRHTNVKYPCKEKPWRHPPHTHLNKNNLAVLPPLPIRSWSTEGGGASTPAALSSRNGSLLWPQSSSSGRTSWWSGSAKVTNSTPSAESPHLEPGRARTAVGNLLVALQQQQDPPGTTPLHDVSHRYNTTDDEWAYSPQEQIVESIYSPMINRTHIPSSRNPNNSVNSAKSNRKIAHPLPMISEQPVIAGMSKVKNQNGMSRNESSATGKGVAFTMFSPLSSRSQLSSDNDKNTKMSTLTSNSSSVSVYSLTQPGYIHKIKNQHPYISTSVLDPIASAANRSEIPVQQLQEQTLVEQKKHGGYSWTVTSSPNCSRSSSQSTGSKASKKTITSTSKSIVFIDQNDFLSQNLDRSMQQSKAHSQKRIKEELIISALERLHDNVQLVSDVEGLLQVGGGRNIHRSNPTGIDTDSQQQQSMYDWFVPTPLNMDGILTGYQDDKRYSILDRIDLFINEFIHAISDDTEESMFSFQKLQEALSFCKVLVQMAIPESEKEDSSLQGTEEIGRWQFRSGLREVIGLQSENGSTTPARGTGDASFFSLPDDENFNCDTPMTSNVSIGASTLTTIVKDYHPMHGTTTTSHHKFGTSIALKQQQLNFPQQQYDGLYLRQAIQMLTTGLQKMTLACHKLCDIKGNRLNPSNLVQVATQIQQAYVQLLSMNHSDLKSIVDAFEFELDTEAVYGNHFDEGICELVDEDEPQLNGPKHMDSPILFAETLGFGVINTANTSLDISYNNDESFNASEEENQHSVSPDQLLPILRNIVDSKLDTTNNKIDEARPHVEKALMIEVTRTNNTDSDDSCSVISFTPTYKSVRLEV
jgi:hypothetical protein